MFCFTLNICTGYLQTGGAVYFMQTVLNSKPASPYYTAHFLLSLLINDRKPLWKLYRKIYAKPDGASLELLNGCNPAHITLLPSVSLNISNFTVFHYLGCDEKDSTNFLVPKTYIQYIRYIVLDFIKDPHNKHKMFFKEIFYLLRIVARVTKSNQQDRKQTKAEHLIIVK